MIPKKKLLRIVLAGEAILFSYFFYYGSHGLKAVSQLSQETTHIQHDVDSIKQEIAHLEQEIDTWEHDEFYKEKLAREHLQMARDGEEIYVL